MGALVGGVTGGLSRGCHFEMARACAARSCTLSARDWATGGRASLPSDGNPTLPAAGPARPVVADATGPGAGAARAPSLDPLCVSPPTPPEETNVGLVVVPGVESARQWRANDGAPDSNQCAPSGDAKARAPARIAAPEPALGPSVLGTGRRVGAQAFTATSSCRARRPLRDMPIFISRWCLPSVSAGVPSLLLRRALPA
ncbi:hypothetical protein T492DRAFT_1129463 [Pavlovales sp. CCMP2436]|nr:hypothetical protein T492DRAFT_1129463 [Pavlovales sp. CCMP2436]